MDVSVGAWWLLGYVDGCVGRLVVVGFWYGWMLGGCWLAGCLDVFP